MNLEAQAPTDLGGVADEPLHQGGTQSALFPEQLEDWITEDNPARAVDAFVDELKGRRPLSQQRGYRLGVMPAPALTLSSVAPTTRSTRCRRDRTPSSSVHERTPYRCGGEGFADGRMPHPKPVGEPFPAAATATC